MQVHLFQKAKKQIKQDMLEGVVAIFLLLVMYSSGSSAECPVYQRHYTFRPKICNLSSRDMWSKLFSCLISLLKLLQEAGLGVYRTFDGTALIF
jgi:hypothetical protein